MSVGQSLPRLNGRQQVTGAVPYAVNMELPGMLHGAILRSPLAHARIVAIDTSRAKALPGVVAVLTGADIAAWGINPYYGPVVRDQPILAIGKVRFAGESVAAVAAASLDVAQEALDLIDVEYDELPAVLDAVDAMAVDAPEVHEVPPQVTGAFADTAKLNFAAGRNVCTHFKLRRGDVTAGFAAADRIFESEFSVPAVQHVALEPHATLARWGADGSGLEVWSTCQNPFVLRAQLQLLFDLPLSQIRVLVPPLGGGFGAKSWPKSEPITVALARATGRPVKVVYSREECFQTITRHACRVRLKTGVTRDGRILARQVTAFYNTGAYAEVGPRVTKNGGLGSPGPYRIPNVQVDSYCVYSNRVPAGAYRGYAIAQVNWAYDQEMDIIAAGLGIDPVALRLQNAYVEGDTFHTGQKLHGIGIQESLEAASRAIGWQEPLPLPVGPVRRGRGIACSIKSTVTPSLSQAAVRLEEDGSVTLLSSSVEMGQGSDTALTQMCAEAMGLPVQRVAMVRPDTSTTPFDQSTTSSRTIFSMGNAIIRAADELKDQMKAVAAELLEVDPADLELAEGRVRRRGLPEQGVAYGDLVRGRFGARIGGFTGRGSYLTDSKGLDPETGQGIASSFWSTSACACEVEVDTDTGSVRVVKIAAAADVGKAINPGACEGQIQGSIVQALGTALFEELIWEGGLLLNPSLLDYSLPTVADLPPQTEAILIENPHAEGPWGAHGVGEAASPPVATAVANAVAAATGVRVHHAPLTPERVLAAIRQSTAPASHIQQRIT